MFSKGTFQRYLFELGSSQERMMNLYARLQEQTVDPAVRRMLAEFISELKTETQKVGEIRTTLQAR